MAKCSYLSINVLFLKLMGMYPISKTCNVLYKTFYYLWRFVCIYCLLTHSIQCIVDIFLGSKMELSDMSPNILNSVIFMGGVVRLSYYYWNARGIETLTDTLNKTFRYKTEEGIYEANMKWYVQFARRLSIFWFWDVFITGEFMALLPLFFIYKNGRVLPIPAWYPWDWKETPYFEISYSFQILTNLHMSFVYGNSDMLYVSYCILTGGQFHLLGLNYKNAIYTALLKYGIPREKVLKFSELFNYYGTKKAMDDVEDLGYFESMRNNLRKNGATAKWILGIKGDFEGISNEKDVYNEKDMFNSKEENEILEVIASEKFVNILTTVFNNCIDQHQILLAYCESVEEFFSPIILPSLSFAMFYVIFMLFTVVTTTHADKTIFLFYVSYICCGLLQVFLINYFGNYLTTQSELARDSLYETPWYLGNQKFKSTFKIVQMRFGKPITLTAGKFFDVSLQTFIAIGKMSFSYFTVLRKVTNNPGQ